MKNIIKRNKAKLSTLVKIAHDEDLLLQDYKKLLNSIHEAKSLRKKANRYGTVLDWENAEFDENLQWLYVTEIIQTPLKEDGCTAIFTSIDDLPDEQKIHFNHLFIN